ncbi:hypothetical protein, partial [Rhizobium straminoryzae]
MNDLWQILAELEAAKTHAEKAGQPLLAYLIAMAIAEAEERSRKPEITINRRIWVFKLACIVIDGLLPVF